MSAMERQSVVVVGDLQAITREGVASGWCWSPQQPKTRRTIALVAQKRQLATAVCDERSPTLLRVGVGDGAHAFSTKIPRDLFPAKAGKVEVQMEDLETGILVGKSFTFSYGSHAPAKDLAPSLRASLDRAGEEGLITGWCWDPATPARRIRVMVLVDGKSVGVTRADIFRGDLASAGIGDGTHAFSYLLPWDVISEKSSAAITLQDADTGQMLPAATVFRRPVLLPVEERLREVEREVKLLKARLEDAQAREQRDTAVIGGVLGTIGAFFTRMAAMPPEDAPLALVPSLAGLLDDVAARRPCLKLAVCAQPLVIICIEAAGSAADIYDCLHALHSAGADLQAEIVLIDDRQSESAALLTASVQNLRFWRVRPGQSVPEIRNDVVLSAARPFVAFLSAATRVSADWLPTCLATFARLSDCSVLGAKVVRPDGVIEASSLVFDEAGQWRDFAQGQHEWTPDCDVLCPVAACTDTAVMIRGEAFARQGGFDLALTDPAMAMADLCVRFSEAGERCFYQPVALVGWQEGVAPQRSPLGHEAPMQWLGQRWMKAHPSQSRSLLRVLLLDGPARSHGGGLDVPGLGVALVRAGVEVQFAVPRQLDVDDPRSRDLRSRGVLVMRAPFQQSVETALMNAAPGFDVIILSAGASAVVSPQDLRPLSTGSRCVLALMHEDGPMLNDPEALAGFDGVITSFALPAALTGEAFAAANVCVVPDEIADLAEDQRESPLGAMLRDWLDATGPVPKRASRKP
jgi:hypothetical protein